jgi:hypothetical protein
MAAKDIQSLLLITPKVNRRPLRKPWMNSRAVNSPGNALKIIESFARITAFSCL